MLQGHPISGFTRSAETANREICNNYHLEEHMRQTKLIVFNFIGCIALMAFMAMTANAQFRAGVQGIVSDQCRGVMPGATVTLTNTETNQSQQTADKR